MNSVSDPTLHESIEYIRLVRPVYNEEIEKLQLHVYDEAEYVKVFTPELNNEQKLTLELKEDKYIKINNSLAQGLGIYYKNMVYHEFDGNT